MESLLEQLISTMQDQAQAIHALAESNQRLADQLAEDLMDGGADGPVVRYLNDPVPPGAE